MFPIKFKADKSRRPHPNNNKRKSRRNVTDVRRLWAPHFGSYLWDILKFSDRERGSRSRYKRVIVTRRCSGRSNRPSPLRNSSFCQARRDEQDFRKCVSKQKSGKRALPVFRRNALKICSVSKSKRSGLYAILYCVVLFISNKQSSCCPCWTL